MRVNAAAEHNKNHLLSHSFERKRANADAESTELPKENSPADNSDLDFSDDGVGRFSSMRQKNCGLLSVTTQDRNELESAPRLGYVFRRESYFSVFFGPDVLAYLAEGSNETGQLRMESLELGLQHAGIVLMSALI
jgi:hypothetical protein